MMNGSLFDTNVVIKIMNGTTESPADIKKEDIFISVITIGELSYGASNSRMKDYNIKLFDNFISRYKVLKADEKSALIYGEVKHRLKSKGVNVPENDMWIAAIAISNDLKLITFDNHFEEIDNLDALIL